MSPKPGVKLRASPGVAQLDFWSGLFLEPGAGADKDEWVLEGRTWAISPTTYPRVARPCGARGPGARPDGTNPAVGGWTPWPSTP